MAIAGVVDRRERRAAEIDAGIEDADHHALAAEIGRVGVPQRRRADQLRADIGGERVLAVFLDQLHAGQFGDARGLVLGHAGDHAVDRVVHAPLDRQRPAQQGADAAFVIALHGIEMAHVAARLGAVHVDAAAAGALGRGAVGILRAGQAPRRRQAGDVAVVGAQRRFPVQHDVAAGVGFQAAVRGPRRRRPADRTGVGRGVAAQAAHRGPGDRGQPDQAHGDGQSIDCICHCEVLHAAFAKTPPHACPLQARRGSMCGQGRRHRGPPLARLRVAAVTATASQPCPAHCARRESYDVMRDTIPQRAQMLIAHVSARKPHVCDADKRTGMRPAQKKRRPRGRRQAVLDARGDGTLPARRTQGLQRMRTITSRNPRPRRPSFPSR